MLVLDFNGLDLRVQNIGLRHGDFRYLISALCHVLQDDKAVVVGCTFKCGGCQREQRFNAEGCALDGLVSRSIELDDTHAGLRLVLILEFENRVIRRSDNDCLHFTISLIAGGRSDFLQLVGAVGDVLEEDEAGGVSCELLLIGAALIQSDGGQFEGRAGQRPIGIRVFLRHLDTSVRGVFEYEVFQSLAELQLLGQCVGVTGLLVSVPAEGCRNFGDGDGPTGLSILLVSVQEVLVLIIGETNLTIVIGYCLLFEHFAINHDFEGCSGQFCAALGIDFLDDQRRILVVHEGQLIVDQSGVLIEGVDIDIEAELFLGEDVTLRGYLLLELVVAVFQAIPVGAIEFDLTVIGGCFCVANILTVLPDGEDSACKACTILVDFFDDDEGSLGILKHQIPGTGSVCIQCNHLCATVIEVITKRGFYLGYHVCAGLDVVVGLIIRPLHVNCTKVICFKGSVIPGLCTPEPEDSAGKSFAIGVTDFGDNAINGGIATATAARRRGRSCSLAPVDDSVGCQFFHDIAGDEALGFALICRHRGLSKEYTISQRSSGNRQVNRARIVRLVFRNHDFEVSGVVLLARFFLTGISGQYCTKVGIRVAFAGSDIARPNHDTLTRVCTVMRNRRFLAIDIVVAKSVFLFKLCHVFRTECFNHCAGGRAGRSNGKVVVNQRCRRCLPIDDVVLLIFVHVDGTGICQCLICILQCSIFSIFSK